jgi:hypothetical protein
MIIIDALAGIENPSILAIPLPAPHRLYLFGGAAIVDFHTTGLQKRDAFCFPLRCSDGSCFALEATEHVQGSIVHVALGGFEHSDRGEHLLSVHAAEIERIDQGLWVRTKLEVRADPGRLSILSVGYYVAVLSTVA